MKWLINRLPITRIKLFLGRILYRILHLIYREDKRIMVRGGIKYEIDLSEAIDLSLFLFGTFQKHISRNRYLSLPQDAIVFDVGANCGAMALQFANSVPSGKVYAFEPTFYAFSKFMKNLELNPELAQRIVPVQRFVSSRTSGDTAIKAYASWKVGGAVKEAKHQVHGGIEKSAVGIGTIALDDFCEQEKIQRLDFVKIDTDGHELEVLKGARRVISKFTPAIIFEIGRYVMDERGINFSDYLEFFEDPPYSLFNSSGLKRIDKYNYHKHIPLKGTIDILAVPKADKGGK